MSLDALKRFREARKQERIGWDSLYQEAADYLLPKRAAWTSDITPGQETHDQIYDMTGTWAAEQFGNGLHSMMASAQSRWFGLRPRGKADRRRRNVLEWRDAAVETLFGQFNSAISSFHPALQESFEDVGVFGYGVMHPEWSEKDRQVMFQALFPGECYLAEDRYGRVSGMVRCYKLPGHQYVETYGEDRLPEADRSRYAQGKEVGPYDITHVVLPRDHSLMEPYHRARGKAGIARSSAFGSVTFCDKVDEPLRVSGFRTFPFPVARWGKRTGQVYPTSPGITALPSVRRANAVQLDLLKISQRWGEPPIQGPDDEHLAPYDLSPGAINYYRPGTRDRVEAINGVLGDPRWMAETLASAKEDILRSFYVDAFLATQDSNGQNVKAAFVYQRRDERFRQLSAMLSRTERQFLGQIVERTYDLCFQNGLIEPPPQDVELELEYESPISRAQRAEILDGLRGAIEVVTPMAQFDPTIIEDGIDGARALRWAAREVYAVPEELFRSDEEIEQRRQARVEQAQNEAMLNQSQAGKNVAEGIRAISQADLAPGQ